MAPHEDALVIWSQKQELIFADVPQGSHVSLPIFIHDELGEHLLTDETGHPVKLCRDTVYHASDHKLYWIDSTSLTYAGPFLRLDLYLGPGAPSLWLATHLEQQSDSEALATATRNDEVHPRELFAFADYFEKGGTVIAGAPPTNGATAPPGWEACSCDPQNKASILEWRPDKRCVQDRWGSQQVELRGHALRMDASRGHIALRRPVTQSMCSTSGRLQVRAQFFDDPDVSGSSFGRWIVFRWLGGCGAIGAVRERYVFANVDFLDNDVPHLGNVVEGNFARSRGWHVFELVWEPNKWGNLALVAKVDGRTIYHREASGQCSGQAETWLVSEPGGSGECGIWGSVEVLHTPLGEGTWEVGVHSMTSGCRRPWRVQFNERGSWMIDSYCMRELTSEEEALQSKIEPENLPEPQEETLEENDEPSPHDDNDVNEHDEKDENAHVEEESVNEPEVCVPHAAAESTAIVAKKQHKKRVVPRVRPRQAPPPPPPSSDFVIECWALSHPEDNVARMHRVMEVVLDRLRDAGVALPANIDPVGQCKASQHASCFVYSFGTRRLHLATREAEGGRLTLVVRIGGGFLDFAQFALKHGAIEQLKLEKRNDSNGNQAVRLCSVLQQKGERSVKEEKTRLGTPCTGAWR
eukprot:TRINITY_DN20340_c0_g1_i1.p1 TRINITY_DN20340_c0_g1~~TRINITY_DN20340_c0_g1_i1.p1  ORF type:complete len:638 (-),score=69.91 TRINITY_DN20340_c0_g1_i1:272-2185(-)